MQVYINRRVVKGPWGGGNMFVKAYHDFGAKSHDVEVLINENGSINPEVILLAGLENEYPDISAEQAIMYKAYIKPDCQIVLRINECDARKGTDFIDEKLVAVSHHVDGVVFVSEWLKDYFTEKHGTNMKGWGQRKGTWGCANNTVIYNGVDHEWFKSQPKLNNGKVNIVAHHWSDNRMKGADAYEFLDMLVGEHPDKFTFTYIGRHQCDFKHTNVMKPLSGKRLGEELGKYDVYVSGTRWDPGPNHILEALACMMPTYVHKDGGGAVEFAGVPASFETLNQLRDLLLETHKRVNQDVENRFHLLPYNAIVPSTWQECVKKYNDFLEATWQRSKST